MYNTNLSHLMIDIDAFIFNAKSEAWLSQANYQKCFLHLDPRHKMVTVCRWGFQKRPMKTLGLHWVGLELTLKKSSLQVIIREHLKNWDRIYGNLYFSVPDSEPIPDLLPFSKAASPVIVENKLFVANLR